MAPRFLIISASFYKDLASSLLKGAYEGFAIAHIARQQIDCLEVPGSFELPCLAGIAARSGKYTAIICLGAVVRGETPHFDYVSAEAARGIMQVSLDTGVPVVFGVLTCDTWAQAEARAGIGLNSSNKGREAAEVALTMVNNVKKLQEMIANGH